MQKIILDTNVIVSALIQKNYPYFVVTYCIRNPEIQICISKNLTIEYINVINRDKFNQYQDFKKKANYILFQITKIAHHYTPTKTIELLNDKGDNKLLELAEISKANFVITGNTNDFPMKHYKKTIITTPKEYWEFYRKHD